MGGAFWASVRPPPACELRVGGTGFARPDNGDETWESPWNQPARGREHCTEGELILLCLSCASVRPPPGCEVRVGGTGFARPANGDETWESS
jgi:hypothetical protein